MKKLTIFYKKTMKNVVKTGPLLVVARKGIILQWPHDIPPLSMTIIVNNPFD